jgi:glycosyltransferase involved in cell wall biosynthesis
VKTALVHDWLVTRGGAENVLEEIWNLYPSPIFTLLHNQIMPEKEIHPSFLQKIPGARHLHRYFLPLFASAIESFNLRNFDLILSSSHAVAKGIKKHQDQLHLCYCHTPMRYAWDLQDHYLQHLKPVQRFGAKAVLRRLQQWDQRTTSRVDHFIANSSFVASRIARIYNRPATVIYPPVSTEKFYISEKKDDFYITLSRLVPYKRVDLIIEAFKRLPHRQLIVIGDGPEKGKLQNMAPPNVHIKSALSDAEVASHLSLARGFIFAAEEDFGIAPVEAQASGTPVIAYGRGGALESVVSGKTGLFFNEQTVESLVEAVQGFEGLKFSATEIKSHAEKFSVGRFRREFHDFVESKWGEFKK